MDHVNYFNEEGHLVATVESSLPDATFAPGLWSYAFVLPTTVPVLVSPRCRMLKSTQSFAFPMQIGTPFSSGNVLIDHERMRLKIEKERQKKLKRTPLQRTCARQELTEHNIPSQLKKKSKKKKVKFSSDQLEPQTPNPVLDVEPPGVHLVRNLNAKRVVAPKQKNIDEKGKKD